MTDEIETPPDNSESTVGQQSHLFQKGKSGNPKGRPPGVRHKTTQLAEKLMAADVEKVVNSVIQAAIAGDMTASRLVLERLVPVRKDAPLSIDLGPIKSLDDVARGMATIVEAVASSELAPSEGAAVASLLQGYSQSLEAADLDRRLGAIETRLMDS